MRTVSSVLTVAGPISVQIPPETQMIQPNPKDFAVKIIFQAIKSLFVAAT